MVKTVPGNTRGFALIEILIAIALLGVVGASFLGALVTSSKTLLMTDLRQTAKNLAEAQLEYINSLPYSASYVLSPDINSAYPSFTIVTQLDGKVHGEVLTSRDANIQKLTVTVQHQGKYILSIVGYKENNEN